MPNVAGRPASCREGFGGSPQCVTLLSEAIRRERQACQLPRGVWGRSTMPNVAFGSKPIRREEAGLGQAKRRGRPASCREGFGGGPKGLTLLAGLL